MFAPVFYALIVIYTHVEDVGGTTDKEAAEALILMYTPLIINRGHCFLFPPVPPPTPLIPFCHISPSHRSTVQLILYMLVINIFYKSEEIIYFL